MRDGTCASGLWVVVAGGRLRTLIIIMLALKKGIEFVAEVACTPSEGGVAGGAARSRVRSRMR